MTMPRSSSRRGSAADESQITPELVAEIADLVYLRLQQELRQLDQMPAAVPVGGSFAAWGERRGDRIVADVIVFSEPN